ELGNSFTRGASEYRVCKDRHARAGQNGYDQVAGPSGDGSGIQWGAGVSGLDSGREPTQAQESQYDRHDVNSRLSNSQVVCRTPGKGQWRSQHGSSGQGERGKTAAS